MSDSAAAPSHRFLNDPRDVVFLPLIAQCLVVAALGIGLFFVQSWFWPLVVAWWVLLGAWVMDRFILMLHCTSHRPLFRKEYGWLNDVLIPWVVSPFMGQTPNSYFVHHIGMHHIEDNLEDDLSTTMFYQRDSIFAWLHYVLRFMTVGLPLLAAYHWRRGTKKLFWRLLAGEAVYWSIIAVLASVNLAATLVVFVMPLLAVRILMMAGNWGQHAFIDPNAPHESWRSSITCINTRYNRRCFNDGYHTTHHKKPRMHYTEMPNVLDTRPEVFGRQDAIVFDGIDFFQVWALLMLRRHDLLAKRMVRLPEAPARTDEEVVAMFRDRLRPLPARVLSPGAASAATAPYP